MSKTNEKKSEKVVKVKGRKKQKKILRTLIVVVLVGLVAFTAFYVAPQVRTSKAKSESDSGNGQLFSTESEIIDILHMSGGNVVVTANSLISFKSNGEERYSESIGYAAPVFKSADRKYIVFERSTGKYTIADSSKIIYQDDLDEEIINADISSNGNYAIITRSTQSTLTVTVYSSKNAPVFSWECSDDYLVDIALSKNGKSVAVSSINVSNGDTFSKLYHFNIDSLEVEGTIEYPNETVYKIKFIDNRNVSVITDLSYTIADMKELESKVLSYEYDKIAGYSFGSKSSVAILKKEFGSLNEKDLIVINKKCERIFEQEIESDILDFETDTKSVYVLISGKILTYSISSGERGDDIDVDGSVEKITLSGSDIFALSENAVYKYSVK